MENELEVQSRRRIATAATASRRDFLRAAGLTGAVLVIPGIVTGCADALAPGALSSAAKNPDNPSFDRPGAIVLNFKTDIGVLNYAYALEQLEAAFYIQVLATPYVGITERETRVLTDVRDHEIVHRDFFRAALGSQRIPDVVPDFSSINFSDRGSVLGAARTFEDLGVGAYNGAAKYLENTDYLVVAGKIVSVEARHASVIGDLIAPRTSAFAPNAFDPALAPTTVIAAADPFIATKIVVVNS